MKRSKSSRYENYRGWNDKSTECDNSKLDFGGEMTHERADMTIKTLHIKTQKTDF